MQAELEEILHLRLARDAEVRVKIGSRLLINIDKFDLWVEENSK